MGEGSGLAGKRKRQKTEVRSQKPGILNFQPRNTLNTGTGIIGREKAQKAQKAQKTKPET